MADDLSDSGSPTADAFRRARVIFEGALERPAHERTEFIAAAVGSNQQLRSDVERMLSADAAAGGWLDLESMPSPGPLPTYRATCQSCRAALAPDHRFCPACGTPIASPHAEERFRAGMLFAGRFRIVSALGRGGMGEVYRAEDLELGHPVALKFLTASRGDGRARNRLRNEVRLARQVSHPNVCRVFDIGEAQGEQYLTMEYVDGEDLAALLRRIGRIPADKGRDIALKLCAGLAAAHGKGLLHRDFKPANIMIDGRGEVRIMDFGLAAIAGRLEPADVRSGTPSHMAPEQLAGREATVRSDLYALGLVMYELFTGTAPFTASDVPDLLRQRHSHPSTTPSTVVPDLDRRIERTILWCLESEPGLRPSSALEVAGALPGGDPLAAALAAGQTPSPEMVAAAGPVEGLRSTTAIALAISTLACLAVVTMLTPLVALVGQMPLRHTPEELGVRAIDVVRSAGYGGDPADFDASYRFDDRQPAAPSGFASREPEGPWPLSFAYRQTNLALAPDRGGVNRLVTPTAIAASGLVSVDIALDGRLLRLEGIPGEVGSGNAAWGTLFTAAGLDITRFAPASPVGDTPLADERLAWTGSYPGTGGLPVRIEAAAVRGRPTLFAVLFPWSDPSPTGLTTARRAWGNPLPIVELVGTLSVFYLGFGLLARYNLKRGRGDPRGAWRLGVGVAAITLLRDTLTGSTGFQDMVTTARPLAFGLTFAVAYLALEPWARRVWPHRIITWTRVVAGRWRDPLVARDALVAAAYVSASHAGLRLVQLAASYSGAGALAPAPSGNFGFLLDHLLGGGVMVSNLLSNVIGGLAVSTVLFFGLFGSYVLLRRLWLAAATAVVLLTAVYFVPSFSTASWLNGLQTLLEIGFLLFLTLRFGVLAAAVFSCLSQILSQAVITYRFDLWYGESSLVGTGCVAAVALYGLAMSLNRGHVPASR